MSDTFSNPAGNAYFADLGITVAPMAPLHGDVWRPHPIMPYVPVAAIPRGQTGWGVRTIADWTSTIAFSENTALVDQAHPTITSTDPTLVGRGFSYSETVQGRQRITDEHYAQFMSIRDQKVVRVLLDGVAYSDANSIINLSASITDITVDAGGAASLDGVLQAIQAVGRPAVAFYCAKGISDILAAIRAEGSYFASFGISDEVRDLAGSNAGYTVHEDGFVFSMFGCKFYQTNNRTGDASRLYENGGNTHGIVMADTRRRAEAARGNTLAQYDLVAPPILLQGREDAIPGLPRVQEPNPRFLSIGSGSLALRLPGMTGEVNFAKWFDLGDNVAGHKCDFGGDYDPILTNSADIRCHQYAS